MPFQHAIMLTIRFTVNSFEISFAKQKGTVELKKPVVKELIRILVWYRLICRFKWYCPSLLEVSRSLKLLKKILKNLGQKRVITQILKRLQRCGIYYKRMFCLEVMLLNVDNLVTLFCLYSFHGRSLKYHRLLMPTESNTESYFNKNQM